jgi:hypothetical protein
MTVRPPIERRMQAGLTDYLLDYDQEAAVKMDLELPADDQSLPNDLRLNIINGVAGSGKTLILLYRLRLLYHLYPNKKFLVLTHNRPLNRDMEGRFARLEGCSPENIEWRTFNGWCYHHWPKQSKWIEPLKSARESHRNLGELICKTRFSSCMFQRSGLDERSDPSVSRGISGCRPAWARISVERGTTSACVRCLAGVPAIPGEKRRVRLE